MSFSGGLRPDRVQLWRVCAVFFQNRAQLWRICAVFFDFSLSSPVETVFKGVQFVHITLSLDPKGDRWHLSVSPTLLRSYPAGQVRRKEKGRPYHRRTWRPLAPIRLANNSCMWLYHTHGSGR